MDRTLSCGSLHRWVGVLRANAIASRTIWATVSSLKPRFAQWFD